MSKNNNTTINESLGRLTIIPKERPISDKKIKEGTIYRMDANTARQRAIIAANIAVRNLIGKKMVRVDSKTWVYV